LRSAAIRCASPNRPSPQGRARTVNAHPIVRADAARTPARATAACTTSICHDASPASAGRQRQNGDCQRGNPVAANPAIHRAWREPGNGGPIAKERTRSGGLRSGWDERSHSEQHRRRRTPSGAMTGRRRPRTKQQCAAAQAANAAASHGAGGPETKRTNPTASPVACHPMCRTRRNAATNAAKADDDGRCAQDRETDRC
jgi:hypothetical protein